jgi:hypothetical protein
MTPHVATEELLGLRRLSTGDALGDPLSSERRGQQRDCLPLGPPGSTPIEKLIACRKVRRRLQASERRSSWEHEAIIALNELSGNRDLDSPCAGADDNSVLQDWARRHVADNVRSWGKPTAGLTRRGAFLELQASHGYGGEPVAVAPLDLDLL